MKNNTLKYSVLLLRSFSKTQDQKDDRKRRLEKDHGIILNKFKIEFKNELINDYKQLTNLAEINPKVRDWLVDNKKIQVTVGEIEANFKDLDLTVEEFNSSLASRKRINSIHRLYSETTKNLNDKYRSDQKELEAKRDNEIKSCSIMSRILTLTIDQLPFDKQNELSIFKESNDCKFDVKAYENKSKEFITERRNFLIKKYRDKQTLSSDDFYPPIEF